MFQESRTDRFVSNCLIFGGGITLLGAGYAITHIEPLIHSLGWIGLGAAFFLIGLVPVGKYEPRRKLSGLDNGLFWCSIFIVLSGVGIFIAMLPQVLSQLL